MIRAFFPRRRLTTMFRISGGTLATFIAFAMAVPPALPLSVAQLIPQRATPQAANFFAKFAPWCGATGEPASNTTDQPARHDPLSCLVHCLRAAPTGPRTPLIAPDATARLTPPVGQEFALQVFEPPTPPRRYFGTAGARDPPVA